MSASVRGKDGDQREVGRESQKKEGMFQRHPWMPRNPPCGQQCSKYLSHLLVCLSISEPSGSLCEDFPNSSHLWRFSDCPPRPPLLLGLGGWTQQTPPQQGPWSKCPSSPAWVLPAAALAPGPGEQAAPYRARQRGGGRKWGLHSCGTKEIVREDKGLLPDGAEGLTHCLFSPLRREQSHPGNRPMRRVGRGRASPQAFHCQPGDRWPLRSGSLHF